VISSVPLIIHAQTEAALLVPEMTVVAQRQSVEWLFLLWSSSWPLLACTVLFNLRRHQRHHHGGWEFVLYRFLFTLYTQKKKVILYLLIHNNLKKKLRLTETIISLSMTSLLGSRIIYLWCLVLYRRYQYLFWSLLWRFINWICLLGWLHKLYFVPRELHY